MYNILSNSELESRVLSRPFYVDWTYKDGKSDSHSDSGDINYENLDDINKMLLYIYSWNLSEICPNKKGIMYKFGWTDYKVSKIFKILKVKGLKCVPTFSENTGLLNGRGYKYI